MADKTVWTGKNWDTIDETLRPHKGITIHTYWRDHTTITITYLDTDTGATTDRTYRIGETVPTQLTNWIIR